MNPWAANLRSPVFEKPLIDGRDCKTSRLSPYSLSSASASASTSTFAPGPASTFAAKAFQSSRNRLPQIIAFALACIFVHFTYIYMWRLLPAPSLFPHEVQRTPNPNERIEGAQPSAPDNSSIATGAAATRPNVHLLIPINKDALNRQSCAAIASALVNGYNPILINWNLEISSDTLKLARHLTKLTGVHNYLKSTRSTIPETDLVLMIDGFDVLVQLPAEHLVKRFQETSKDWPDNSGLVITAADKGCWPNHFAEPKVCRAAPKSPLPEDTYGNEKPSEYRAVSTNRPRWVNSGMILGTARNMRALYEELHTSPEQGKWESDQFVFNRLLAAGRVVPDYHSKFMWTANANLHVLDHIPVPRPIDGLQSGIPYEEDTLPRLGIDKATGQIPIFLHFNMSKKTANSSRFRDKAELMNNSLQRMWWSNGANKAFRAIARQRLHEGKIYIDHAKGKTMLFANLCRDLFEL